jgi:hypothetical protein
MESAESMGIGIEAECFFSETKTFFSNLIKFLLILEGIQVFYKLENKASPSKII